MVSTWGSLLRFFFKCMGLFWYTYVSGYIPRISCVFLFSCTQNSLHAHRFLLHFFFHVYRSLLIYIRLWVYWEVQEPRACFSFHVHRSLFMYTGLFCDIYIMCVGLFWCTYVSVYTGKCMGLVYVDLFMYTGLFCDIYIMCVGLFWCTYVFVYTGKCMGLVYVDLFVYEGLFLIDMSLFIYISLFLYT